MSASGLLRDSQHARAGGPIGKFACLYARDLVAAPFGRTPRKEPRQ